MKFGSSRKRVFATLLIIVFAAIMLWLPGQLREQRLYNELRDYQEKVDQGLPTSGVAPQLSPKVIPVLLGWITDHSVPRDARRRLIAKLQSAMPWSSALSSSVYGSPRYLRSQLAVVGFALLGEDAAAALPRLVELARIPDPFDAVLTAMASIGERSFPLAMEFCASSDENMRAKGARLIRGLRIKPDVSVPILMKLTRDVVPLVRTEAFSALAEFPTLEVQSHLLAQISALSPEEVQYAAYAMHAGGTNFLVRLIDYAESNTNYAVRSAILASITFEDYLSDSTQAGVRGSATAKASAFETHSLTFIINKNTPLGRDFFDQLRSNVVTRGRVTRAEVLYELYVKRTVAR